MNKVRVEEAMQTIGSIHQFCVKSKVAEKSVAKCITNVYQMYHQM